MYQESSLTSDPLWYKDVIMYQVHVKTFYDKNSDGYGDFQGLTSKLDHIQALGADCIWLLPFFPSPLRDDGYDIADYTGINPIFGDELDFRRFLDEAHQRGIKVLIELVINHTSDQHPWFQAARRAPKGSEEHNFYVWSDTNDKYKDVRIIFTDSETSNWTWDPIAQQYYWHRFFHHQPDLNFDNPKVVESVERFLRFWLEMGVDGFRLDAVPYLIEREGSSCESLPETHMILKRLRKFVDDNFENRIFLAEANLWPSEVRAFFGSGDECHMAFHFPLMPRIFMAVHQEDRHPIVEIMTHTPALPDNCQWAIFLRNHDELTLEMVSDEERDYMYKAYAADPIMRINLGIRRRLAPLMENNRKCIELMNNLLLSMPGTPVIYYGDEIGMGDNVFQGDRNGVRTPMQWTSDRNAGFSSAPFARLYCPPNMDAVFGYQSVNVEAQNLDQSSLLNWMKHIVRLRKNHKVFSRGSIEFLHPANRKILAYIRSYEGEDVLVVSNLSRYSQAAELDLSAFYNYTPVEMFGLGEFPTIEPDHLYTVMLGPYAFYWLQLRKPSEREFDRSLPRVTSEATLPESNKYSYLPVLTVPQTTLNGFLNHEEAPSVVQQYLYRKSWCLKETSDQAVLRKIDCILLEPSGRSGLIIVQIDGDENKRDYLLVLALVGAADYAKRGLSQESVLASILDNNGSESLVVEGLLDSESCQELYRCWIDGIQLPGTDGCLEFTQRACYDTLKPQLPQTASSARLSSGDSTVSINYADALVLKLLRSPQNLDVSEALVHDELLEKYPHLKVPRVLGALSYKPRDDSAQAVAVLQEYVRNEGDAWHYTVEELRRYYERVGGHKYLERELLASSRQSQDLIDCSVPETVSSCVGIYIRDAALLGQSLAELHLALSNSTVLEPAKILGPRDFSSMAQTMRSRASSIFDELKAKASFLPERTAVLAFELINRQSALESLLESLADSAFPFSSLECPDDLHLGQLLCCAGTFVFTQVTPRPWSQQRPSKLALENLAVILRSFYYATQVSLQLYAHDRVDEMDRLQTWAKIADRWIGAVFLRDYLRIAGDAKFLPERREDLLQILQSLLVDRALCELRYELSYRPEWLQIPLQSLIDYSHADV